MKKIPLIGALIAAIFVAFRAIKRKKAQEPEMAPAEPDTTPGEGHPAT